MQSLKEGGKSRMLTSHESPEPEVHVDSSDVIKSPTKSYLNMCPYAKR